VTSPCHRCVITCGIPCSRFPKASRVPKLRTNCDFYEWNPWLFGYLDQVPKEKPARLDWTRRQQTRRAAGLADRFRSKLIDLLGPEKGKEVKYAEAFEVCEYGSQPSKEELLRIFPFFGH
jgi:N-acetylglucosamine malate deacetylase 1